MMIDMNWTFGFFKSEIIENFYDYWLIIHSLLVIIQNLGRKKKGVTKKKISLFLTLHMCSITKKNDRTDRLFASPPPKSTFFGPL